MPESRHEEYALCLDPIEWDSYDPDAPCISPKLEDFVSEAVFDVVAKQNEEERGSTLHRTLCVDFQSDDKEILEMESLDPGYYSDLPYHATNVLRVTDEDEERVYSAHIEAVFAHQTVILKFAYNEEERQALHKEAGFYQNELRRVQKIFVPTYIGHFGTSDGEVTCLVVSFEGEPIECAFQELPAEER
jgi:hypothetical protein